MLGERDAGGGKFRVEVFLRRTWHGGKSFVGLLFPVLVGIARSGSSREQCFSRYASFAAHVKFWACWKEFFLNVKTWPGFSSQVWLA